MAERSKTPVHVAIIMDGNGRWAKKRGLDRTEGHVAGVESVRRTVKAAVAEGVRYLTLYTFSTENWGRPKEEVDAIMELFCRSVISETAELCAQGVKVRLLGDRSAFSDKVKAYIEKIESETSSGNKLTLILAMNYSSHNEMAFAVRDIARRVESGKLKADSITEQTISDSLMTAEYPDPDLVIRTGGEYRLSNFLLWQSAYSELYFTPQLWPDFDKDSLAEALDDFAGRERRYGLVGASHCKNNTSK